MCLNWNDSNTSRSLDKDEAFSCISDDSKTTFKSVRINIRLFAECNNTNSESCLYNIYLQVRPSYNRSQSVADTFMSTHSEA